MFDRFSDRAKTAMNLARQEAQRLNHDYLGPEHVLLGLLLEGTGTAVAALRNLQVGRAEIRAEIERLVTTGPAIVAMGQIPFTPRAKKVLEHAMEAAADLGHRTIGTEHLLLGIIAERENAAARALVNLGVDLEDARKKVIEAVGPGDAGGVDAAAGYPSALGELLARQQELSQETMERATELEATLARQGRMLRLLWIAVAILVAYVIFNETR